MKIYGENKYEIGKISFADTVKLLKLIDTNDLVSMDAIELYTIIQQSKLPSELKQIMFTEPNTKERVKAIEKVIKELEEKNESAQTQDSQNEEVIDSVDTDQVETIEENTDDAPSDEEEPNEIIKIKAVKELSSLDNKCFCMIDEEAMAVLVNNKVRKLWNYILNGVLTLEDITKQEGGKFFTEVKRIFNEEYDNVTSIPTPVGYSLPFQPNLMQKLCVYRLSKMHNYGNWSGMGAGKTLSFILASRILDARVTIVIALNSAIEPTPGNRYGQIEEDIMTAFPDSVVYTQWTKNCVIDYSKHNYILFNYEKFQTASYADVFSNLSSTVNIDFIVADEIHFAKQRSGVKESYRRSSILNFVTNCRKANSNMYVLVMTGTPVINELFEAKSVLQILTGMDYSDLSTTRTVPCAINVYKHLLINGMRYVPKYNIGLRELTGDNTEELSIDCSDKIELLKELSKNDNRDFLGLEKLVINEKLNSIKRFMSKGSVIFTKYTTGFVTPIVKAVTSWGFTYGLYTGEDKTGLEPFKRGEVDILIASFPISTSINGLQYRSSKMFIISLPWTNAEYSQLVGRIYRQGQEKDVTVFIPQVKIGEDCHYDKDRFDVIKKKKSLADCATDGIIPSKNFPSIETLSKKAFDALNIWLERVSSGETVGNNRSELEVSDCEERAAQVRERAKSLINEMHSNASRKTSKRLHQELIVDKTKWYEYHRARDIRRSSWIENPLDIVATKINESSVYGVIADLGCGENELKSKITAHYGKWLSFDHVAINHDVIEADTTDLSAYVDDGTLDVAVYCLSLWGTNFTDYFKEAARILKRGGIMYVVEPSKSPSITDGLVMHNACSVGLIPDINECNKGNKFTYLKFIKK